MLSINPEVAIALAEASFPALKRVDLAFIINLQVQFSSKYDRLTFDISFLMKYWV